MSKFPSKPQKGSPALQAIYNSVCQIIDYLPTLKVVGDNKTTSVKQTGFGTTIHAIQPITVQGQSRKYEAGSGLFLSGNVFNVSIDPNTMAIVNNKLSCTVQGGGGPSVDTNTTYTGELNQTGSGWIYVDPNTLPNTDTHVISSTLRWLQQLDNVDITSAEHYLQVSDVREGAGTTINYHYSSKGDHTVDGGGPDTLVKWIDGIEVDLNVSGGTYITTNFYKGVGYGDYSSASINCNLSGDRDVNHPYGLISIVPQYDASYNITGGIISTNLHAGTGIAIDPSTGEISLTGSGGGGNVPTPVIANTVLSANSQGQMTWQTNTAGGSGGGGCPWPAYENLGEESNSIVYPLMRYTATNGGWLRISDKNNSRCNGVWIGDNYVGLGFGADTWTLAIPPGSSFYIDMDFNPTRTKAWFDSTVSPATITIEEFEYWGITPQWDPNYQTINDLKHNFDQARAYESSCYNCMTGAAVQLKLMVDDWAKFEHEYTSQPESVEWYQAKLDEMNKILSGDDDNLGCDYYLSEATDYAAEVATLNNSLPSANPMFAYQATDIPIRCQEYYDKIQQYITSGQYYYNLADDYWQAHSQE